MVAMYATVLVCPSAVRIFLWLLILLLIVILSFSVIRKAKSLSGLESFFSFRNPILSKRKFRISGVWRKGWQRFQSFFSGWNFLTA